MKNLIKDLFIFNFLPFIAGILIVTDNSVKKSIFYGWFIVFISIGVGVLSFNLSKNKDNKSFLKIYFGGMVFRLILLLLIIFSVLKFVGINPISFLFSLFIFYIINQIIEIKYITKSFSK